MKINNRANARKVSKIINLIRPVKKKQGKVYDERGFLEIKTKDYPVIRLAVTDVIECLSKGHGYVVSRPLDIK